MSRLIAPLLKSKALPQAVAAAVDITAQAAVAVEAVVDTSLTARHMP
jgi:hypothetical protein